VVVRFQVLTAESMNVTPFWDIAPCSLVESDPRFRGTYCLRHQGDILIIALKIEAVYTSEKSVYFNETTRRFISQKSVLVSRVVIPKEITYT
jgi:hypothetical protein